jgi:putative transcriptional regulator
VRKLEIKLKCKLKVIFAERNIKYGVFAERVGVTGTTISSLANGRSLPKFEVAYKIAKELKLPIEEIWVEE